MDRFHKHTVKQVDAERVLGRPVGEGNGLDWHLFIGGGLMTAMFAWDDNESTTIEEAFYKGGPIPDKLLVNEDHVKAVAEAAAARLYSVLLDRVEGQYAVPYGTDVRPTGALSSVNHILMPNGAAGAVLNFPPILDPEPIEAYLPESVLRVVQKRVQE